MREQEKRVVQKVYTAHLPVRIYIIECMDRHFLKLEITFYGGDKFSVGQLALDYRLVEAVPDMLHRLRVWKETNALSCKCTLCTDIIDLANCKETGDG